MLQSQSTLGQLLKGLRNRNGWTLKEMSERCSIPVSTLSKVEHDRLTLTYDKLLQISQKLKIRISELFAEPEVENTTSFTARRSLGSLSKALRVTTPIYDHFYLCTDLRRKRMIPIITTIRAKTLEEFGDLIRHAGEEFSYVLKGSIVVHTEFYDAVLLKEGDSIYLDSTMGHAYLLAPGCEEAVMVDICSGEEDLMETLPALFGHEAEGNEREKDTAGPKDMKVSRGGRH